MYRQEHAHVTDSAIARPESNQTESTQVMADFLGRYGHPSVIGADLAARLGDGTGEERFRALLQVCGHADDAVGFFATVQAKLATESYGDWRSFDINGTSLPHAVLFAVLEAMDPGDRLKDVTSVAQLERLIARAVPRTDRDMIQDVLDRFPVRLSQHSLRQLRLSHAVADQYLPFVSELEPEGLVHTWVGQFHSGVVERMYHNRIIMILNMSCPVYCRFCFRKHKECRHEPPPTRADVEAGVAYVASCPEITEAVLTGGDPFMNRTTMTCAIEGLLEIDHVRCLRLATRSLSYHPALFTRRHGFWLKYLKAAQKTAAARHKRIEVATHFIHRDELSVRSLDLIAELVSSGIAVYVQTPLLGGINDTGDELLELYQSLRSAGAEMHYVFMPCSPLQGNGFYRSTIDDGMRLAARLRGKISDRAMPHFCTATSIGKIDWGVNGWVVEKDKRDSRFVWLRTPYTEEVFSKFAKQFEYAPEARVNAEGTLDARFMVDVGDRRWLRGHRGTQPSPETMEDRAPSSSATQKKKNNHETTKDHEEENKSHPPEPGAFMVEFNTMTDIAAPQTFKASKKSMGGRLDPAEIRRNMSRFRELQDKLRLETGHQPIRRVHPTRVEVDLASSRPALAQLIDKLGCWEQVTDVVLWSSKADPLLSPKRLSELFDRLATMPQLTSIRVRSRTALDAPKELSWEAIDVLFSHNRLGVVAPLRIELEINLLHGSQLKADHRVLIDRLRNRGVTTYNISLLLAGINRSASGVRGISDTCRLYGIEFCHLIVAGHPAQQQWHAVDPVSIDAVVEIASELRRFGSGRELPRYVIESAWGEVDLGMTAEYLGPDANGDARLRVMAYSIDTNAERDSWAKNIGAIEIDAQGYPIVSIPGLIA